MSLALNGTNGVTYNDGTLQSSAPGGKNLIINGDMKIAQRGTSFTGITDQYTLDRWTSSSAGGVSLNVSQQTATSSDNAHFASEHFARYQRNAVYSGFVHKVENLQQFNNKTFTLSFWAKSSDAGTNIALTAYTMNDGSSFNSYVTRTDVTNPTLSSTWQKYEMRLTFQDMYPYGYSGSHHLRLQFFDGANAATFDIAEVQLEVGTTATDFENLQYGQQLALCQRYYWRPEASNKVFGTGYVVSATRADMYSSLPVSMRASPSIVNTSVAIRINYAAVSVLATTITLLASSTTGFSAYITGASGLTVGQGVTLANNGVLELNAEL